MKLPEKLEFEKKRWSDIKEYIIRTNIPCVVIKQYKWRGDGKYGDADKAKMWHVELYWETQKWTTVMHEWMEEKHETSVPETEKHRGVRDAACGDLRHCKAKVQELFDQLKAHKCDFSDCAECERHNKCLAEWWYWRDAQQCNHDCGNCGSTTGCNERERYNEWEAQF